MENIIKEIRQYVPEACLEMGKITFTKNNHKLAPWNYQQKHPELK